MLGPKQKWEMDEKKSEELRSVAWSSLCKWHVMLSAWIRITNQELVSRMYKKCL